MLKDFVSGFALDILWLCAGFLLLCLFAIIFFSIYTAVEMAGTALREKKSQKRYSKRRALIDEVKDTLSTPRVPQFVCNYHKGVFAFTTRIAFEHELNIYYKRIGTEGTATCEPVMLWVPMTYTFASTPDTVRPVHTGDRKFLEATMILSVISKFVNHFSFNDLKPLSESEIEELIVCFSKKDARLFVPYSGSVPNATRQLQVFGVRSQDEFVGMVNSMR